MQTIQLRYYIWLSYHQNTVFYIVIHLLLCSFNRLQKIMLKLWISMNLPLFTSSPNIICTMGRIYYEFKQFVLYSALDIITGKYMTIQGSSPLVFFSRQIIYLWLSLFALHSCLWFKLATCIYFQEVCVYCLHTSWDSDISKYLGMLGRSVAKKHTLGCFRKYISTARLFFSSISFSSLFIFLVYFLNNLV